MKHYVVIDTNVLVSALLSSNKEAATVQLLRCLYKREIIPVYSDDAYLVTGNLKHFPKRTYIVTARQMLDILDENKVLSNESDFRGSSAVDFN